jgi:hypothetical protein
MNVALLSEIFIFLLKMSGGRTFPAIVTENFTISKKRNDKTNRYELECNHCSTVIINRVSEKSQKSYPV